MYLDKHSLYLGERPHNTGFKYIVDSIGEMWEHTMFGKYNEILCQIPGTNDYAEEIYNITPSGLLFQWFADMFNLPKDEFGEPYFPRIYDAPDYNHFLDALYYGDASMSFEDVRALSETWAMKLDCFYRMIVTLEKVEDTDDA